MCLKLRHHLDPYKNEQDLSSLTKLYDCHYLPNILNKGPIRIQKQKSIPELS